jgi:aminopeptidase YwaD
MKQQPVLTKYDFIVVKYRKLLNYFWRGSGRFNNFVFSQRFIFMKIQKLICLLILVAGQFVYSQKIKKSDQPILANLQAHIQYLSNDKLEGRRTGSPGEFVAMNYIAEQFKQMGLQPKGNEGYFQPFDINEGKQITPATHFSINKNELKIDEDFFPFTFSPTLSIEAFPAIALQEPDMPWFIDLKDILAENKENNQFILDDWIYKQATELKKRGASALIFYNSSDIEDNLKFDPKNKQELVKIPVIYVKKNAAKKYFGDPSASIEIKLKTEIGEKKRTGHNVIGYINNGAPTTVILGAHYDHLGYGEDGNSMLRTGERLIHNGADDNASGTAALIELARLIKNSGKKDLKNNNYLFITFSGEEMGLYGSKYFVENPTVDLGNVNYMINMDMVGRLNDSTKSLTIGGFGTSPEWGSLIKLNDKKSPFTIKIDSSGTGPSDHTSFYRKEIPVLFFFTGLHSDYHKPTDDYDKINYLGELTIVKYIYSLLEKQEENKKKLVFTKTRETQTSTSARLNGVTMGIMPDYTFSGTGVKVDGVSDGKPAQAAGLQAGDIILQLGDYNTSSLENYMQALGKFKKGDSAIVKIKRGGETIEKQVKF